MVAACPSAERSAQVEFPRDSISAPDGGRGARRIPGRPASGEESIAAEVPATGQRQTLGYASPVERLTDTLGRPLRDLRISVTDRCNFRCVYCMPKEVFGRDYAFLARDELLTFEEIARLARVFVGLGVEKLRLTGGEPLAAPRPRDAGRAARADRRART